MPIRDMLKYPTKCAAAGSAGAHLGGDFNNQWHKKHALTSYTHGLQLMNFSVVSKYFYIEKVAL